MISYVRFYSSGAMRYVFAALVLLLASFFSPGSLTTIASADEGGILLESFPWISVAWDENNLLLRISGLREGSYNLYELERPPRIVIDIPDLLCENEPVSESYDFTDMGLITQLRANCDAERTRIVLESRFPVHWEITSPESADDLDIFCYLRFRQTIEEIAIDEGTTYIARRYVTPSGQRFAHIVVSDPALSRLRPRIFLSSDVTTRSLSSIDSIVSGSRAAAGVNGGYFQWPGISLSLVIQDGEIRYPPQLHRPAFMISEDGSYMMGYPPIRAAVESSSGLRWEADVINQAPGPGRIALLTPGHPSRIRSEMPGSAALFLDGIVEAVTYDAEEIENFADRTILWSRRSLLPLELLGVNEEVEISYIVDSDSPIAHAIQGGPFLLRNGRVDITSEEDDIGRDIANGRAARTAVGIDSRGRVYLVVVEGSSSGRSIGSSLQEMAWSLLELGATWAINLDGGSSSGMALGFHTPDCGLPSGGRRIATALVLIDESGRMQGENFYF